MLISIRIIISDPLCLIEQVDGIIALSDDRQLYAFRVFLVDDLLDSLKVQRLRFCSFGDDKVIFRMNLARSVPARGHPQFALVTLFDWFKAHASASQSSMLRR